MMTINKSVGKELIFPLTLLKRRPEKIHHVNKEVSLGGLEISTARVPEGRVGLDLTVELSREEVLVAGKVVASWSAECRRCIEEISGQLKLTISEIFLSVNQFKDEVNFNVEDAFPFKEIDGEEAIDLEEVVRDSILLALPFSPLCSEECQGPDPQRFPTHTNIEKEDSEKDPRWAVLDQLKFDKDNSA